MMPASASATGSGRSFSRRHWLAACGALALLQACGKKAPRARALAPGATVLALGDSLTSGVGAGPQQDYPSVLGQLTGWQVVNGGISGHTTAQALERLPGLLATHRPALVIVSIGGNDFLRRLSADTAKDHIRSICRQSLAAGAQVLLVAVPQPSLMAALGTGSLGDHPLYAQLADELKLPLHAGGWSGVLGDASLRSDQIHANAQGYRRFALELRDAMRRMGFLA
jgi:acyl-CoA hydrolase